MTARTHRLTVSVAELVRAEAPDFTRMDSLEAHRHIRALAASGWADQNIALCIGWHTNDVRRALSSGSGCRP